MKFFSYTEHPTVVGVPDNQYVRDFLDALVSELDSLGEKQKELIQRNKIRILVAPNVEEMTEIMYTSNSNAIGLEWVNSEEDHRYTSPEIRLYTQFFGTLKANLDTFNLIFWFISGMKHSNLKVAFMNTSTQVFAHPEAEQFTSMSGLIPILCSLPIIFATMAEVHMIIEEKSSQVQMLSFLMGCSETVYFTVSIVVQILMSCVMYAIICACMCYAFFFRQTEFWLLFVISIVFVISQVFFQMFLTTLMKTAESGRLLSVILVVCTVFFSLLHSSFTLNDKNESELVKHVFSVIPVSAYEMIIMTIYRNSFNVVPTAPTLFNWDNNTGYLLIWGIIWLVIDAIVYLLLFVLFNATTSRVFGHPAITLREILRCKSWKSICSKCSNNNNRIASHEHVVCVENLCKTYQKNKALSDVSFSVSAGEVIVIIGSNGAGKSTLMNILSGAIQPTSGSISIMGEMVTPTCNPMHMYGGVCFQENVLIDWLTVKEHFFLFGTFRGLSKELIEDSVDFFTDQLALTSIMDNRTGTLSGGQKRKLCVALSLLGSPPLVIMDEPTAGVDVQSRKMIWKTISMLRDTTVLVTTHAIEEAETSCSRIFVISKGNLVFKGSTAELRQEYHCGYILRVECDNIKAVFDSVASIVSSAELDEATSNAIRLQSSKNMAKCLEILENSTEVHGFTCYTENIEDMVLKLIM